MIALVANQHFNKIIQLRVLSQEPIDTVQRCLVLDRRIIRFRAFLKLLFDLLLLQFSTCGNLQTLDREVGSEKKSVCKAGHGNPIK